MTPETLLPLLLGLAVLLPLLSFVVLSIGFSIPQYLGRSIRPAFSHAGGQVAIAAIAGSAILSLVALLAVWIPTHGVEKRREHVHPTLYDAPSVQSASDSLSAKTTLVALRAGDYNNPPPTYYAGDWYTLANFDG